MEHAEDAPGRSEDESEEAVGITRESLEDRNSERDSLSGTSLCASNAVGTFGLEVSSSSSDCCPASASLTPRRASSPTAGPTHLIE